MKYLIGNLKMNLNSLTEVKRYFEVFKSELRGKKLKDVEIILCPPFVYLEKFTEELKSKKVSIGVQNIFCEKCGAYTGEISPPMVKNLGADYAIVGHSERRKYFGETDETINLKIKAAIKNRLTAVFCFGETLEERGAELTSQIIKDQIEKGLEDVSSVNLEKIIFAYEPVWAVGTDTVPTSNAIMEIKILVRKILSAKYGVKCAQKIPVLYGGSVKAKIFEQVCQKPGMDGVLVGRESLDPYEFIKIAELLNEN